MCVARLTIQMPDDLADLVRREASRAQLSVSEFLSELVRARLQRIGWSEDFLALFGEGLENFPAIDDPPPEEVEGI